MRSLGRIALLGAAATIIAGEAHAQWAFLARRAIGRVEHLAQSQQQNENKPRYDVATVLLDADASKVYATALRMIKENHEVTIVSESAATRKIEVARGEDRAGLTVTELGKGFSQLLVAALVNPGETSPSATVVDRVLAVCQRLKVKCSAAAQ